MLKLRHELKDCLSLIWGVSLIWGLSLSKSFSLSPGILQGVLGTTYNLVYIGFVGNFPLLRKKVSANFHSSKNSVGHFPTLSFGKIPVLYVAKIKCPRQTRWLMQLPGLRTTAPLVSKRQVVAAIFWQNANWQNKKTKSILTFKPYFPIV